MPKHKFTLSEQLKAVERALSSPKTPGHLRESLRRRATRLRKQVAKQESSPWLFRALGIARRQK
jgi:hypothetical protein